MPIRQSAPSHTHSRLRWTRFGRSTSTCLLRRAAPFASLITLAAPERLALGHFRLSLSLSLSASGGAAVCFGVQCTPCAARRRRRRPIGLSAVQPTADCLVIKSQQLLRLPATSSFQNKRNRLASQQLLTLKPGALAKAKHTAPKGKMINCAQESLISNNSSARRRRQAKKREVK